MYITLDKALTLLESNLATYVGTTHTDRRGCAAIITRHDKAAVDHVADVGKIEIASLERAAEAK